MSPYSTLEAQNRFTDLKFAFQHFRIRFVSSFQHVVYDFHHLLETNALLEHFSLSLLIYF
jgi:hypothetical protein